MSSLGRADKISIVIPILFTALMIGSLIGIIGNSLLVDSSESGFDNEFSLPFFNLSFIVTFII